MQYLCALCVLVTLVKARKVRCKFDHKKIVKTMKNSLTLVGFVLALSGYQTAALFTELSYLSVQNIFASVYTQSLATLLESRLRDKK